MNEDLRAYINGLFEKAPNTRANYELKEELIANSNDRYFDLVEGGMPEDEAFKVVIDSIGDVEDLFETEEQIKIEKVIKEDEEKLKKKALFKTISIGLYIFGFILMIILAEMFDAETWGFVAWLTVSAIATCIIVYQGTAYPKYKGYQDTVVEEFKEWNSTKSQYRGIMRSINVIVWMFVVIAYFIISFMTMAWYITWVMFLIGGCIQAIVSLVFQIKIYDKK